jgi:hypothetical protein
MATLKAISEFAGTQSIGLASSFYPTRIYDNLFARKTEINQLLEYWPHANILRTASAAPICRTLDDARNRKSLVF